jgi:phosphoglycolate phosphatase
MKGQAMRTVVFDLDGTLADTSADLLAAANACFQDMGLGAQLGPGDALTAFQGGRAMLRLGFARAEQGSGEAAVAAAFPVFLGHYAEGLDRETRLYPGAVAAVEALRAAGYACAICTNKPEGLAEELLRRLGIRDLFGALVGADTFPVRKPDPLPYRASVERAGGQVARSMLVGDTLTDRDTARAAGVPVVLVSFGPEGDAVARWQPDAVLDHFDGLAAIALRLIS